MITPKRHYVFFVEQVPSLNVCIQSIKDKKGEVDLDLDYAKVKYEATVNKHVCRTLNKIQIIILVHVTFNFIIFIITKNSKFYHKSMYHNSFLYTL